MTTSGKGAPKARFESPADDDSVQKQICAAAKQALQAKQQGPRGKSAKAKDGEAS